MNCEGGPPQTPCTGPAVLRKRLGRNELCHCGSHRKYKRCCQVRDEARLREERGARLPAWFLDSTRKYHQFVKYSVHVYGLPHRLQSFIDSRRSPTIPTFDVVNSLFQAAVLRRPSINAVEGDLKTADFQRMLGLKPEPNVKAFSAEVISNVLDKLDLASLRDGVEDVIWTAERNKAFREGSYGTLRCVAIDGWEPFASYDRHCSHCLVRKVKRKNSSTGKVEETDQYYHRYAVALLLGPALDVVLDLEPVRNDEARRDAGEDARHEGELTASHRLIDRLHDTFGTFIDAFVLDALYANGPVMTKLDDYGYGGFIILKKNNNEPLREALALWEDDPPCRRLEEKDQRESIEFWDAPDLDTLKSYRGKVRVIRAVVTKKDGTRKTWCFGVVGKRAQKVGLRAALKLVRSRWHIENTAFNQWVQHWNLGRVYRHTPNALMAVLLLWSFAFNLLQLFVYRRLKRDRTPKDPCDTIINIVAQMFRDVGALLQPIPWRALADAAPG